MLWLSTVHVSSQLRLFSSSTNGTPILPSDLRSWTVEQVQQWIKTHNDGQFAKYADKFAGLTGEQICDMTKEDFILFVGGPFGAVVFNDVQKLLDHGHVPQLTFSRVVLNRHATNAPPPGDGEYAPNRFKYVDKSAVLSQILQDPHKFWFVTAPRRFGKSVMLNMLAHLALGHWDAFPEHDRWDDDPSDVRVIMLDLKGLASVGEVEDIAERTEQFIVDEAFEQHGLELKRGGHPLQVWIDMLVKRGHRVVVLIDEYDHLVVNTAVSGRIQRADDLCTEVLKPLLEATKSRPPELIKVVVTGVSSVSLKTIGSGAGFFHHAFDEHPEWCVAVGYTPDELLRTYGDAVLGAFRDTCAALAKDGKTLRWRQSEFTGDPTVDAVQATTDGAPVECDLDTAVSFLKTRGNGWCLDYTGQIELFSPFVVNSWLGAPNLFKIERAWIASGEPAALVQAVRARAPELLERRVCTLDELTRQMRFAEYFHPSNLSQLAFQFGYLSIRARSWRGNAGTLELQPPNDTIRRHVADAVAICTEVNREIANRIGDAIRESDWSEFREGIAALAADFKRAFGRPFENERELHSWGATWVTTHQPIAGAAPIRSIAELRHAIDEKNLKTVPKLDTMYHFARPDGRVGVLVVDWGIAHSKTGSLRHTTEKKAKQIRCNNYLERGVEFLRDQGVAVDDNDSHAIACVFDSRTGEVAVCDLHGKLYTK